MQCDSTCRTTKGEGYLNTQTDAIHSDTATVTDIRYFTATADSTESHSGCILETSELIQPDVMWFGGKISSLTSQSVFLQSVKLWEQSCFDTGHVYLQTYTPSYVPSSNITLEEGLAWSSHQTEHGDLPLAISISWANWRWFSITALTSGNRRIRVILSFWQAVIKETIWQPLCFMWITAWFMLSAWRMSGRDGCGGACVKCVLIGVL